MGRVLFVKVCKLDLKQPSLYHSTITSDFHTWKISIKNQQWDGPFTPLEPSSQKIS